MFRPPAETVTSCVKSVPVKCWATGLLIQPPADALPPWEAAGEWLRNRGPCHMNQHNTESQQVNGSGTEVPVT